MLVLKLISTAFDVGDGAKPRGATLTPHQVACALPQRPSLLAFAVRDSAPGCIAALRLRLAAAWPLRNGCAPPALPLFVCAIRCRRAMFCTRA